jgi:hypothetical protein
LSTIGEILGSLVSKAKEKITEFAEKIKEGAKSAVTKFIDFIKQLPSKVAYYLGYVIGKAVLFVTQFPAKAKEAGQKFITYLINFIKQLPGKVATFLSNVITKVANFATNFVNHARTAGLNFLQKLITGISQAPAKIAAMATSMLNAIKSLPSKFLSMGKNIVDGVINGIKDKVSSAIGAVKDFAGNIVSGFKDALGIASPSKVAKKQIGEQIANGVIAGIDAKVKAGKIKAKKYSESLITAAESKLDALETYNKISTKKEAAYWKTILKKMKKGTSDYLTVYKKYIQSIEDANSEAYSNAETKLSNYKVYYDTSYKYEMDYWNKVRKQFKKGTQERIDADEKYLEAKQNYYDAIKELDEQYLEDQQEIYDTLKDDIQDLMDAYNDALESRTNAIMDSFKLFDSYTQKDAVTAQTLIENLQSQEEAMQLYTDNLNALYARELPEDFLESIKDMGVDATQNIIALNSMTDEELSNYVLRWQELNKQAKEQATVDLSGLREETVTQIEELTKTADDKLAELSETYEKNLEDLGTTAKKAAATAGTNTTKALAKAVKSGTSEVVANVKTLKELMLKQLNAIDTKVQSIASGLQESISSMVELQELKDAQAASSSDSYSGSHANGLDYVPYDGYIARLHKGEAVLTAEENRNKSSVSEGNSFYFYGTPPLDEKETARQMKLAQQQLAMGF